MTIKFTEPPFDLLVYLVERCDGQYQSITDCRSPLVATLVLLPPSFSLLPVRVRARIRVRARARAKARARVRVRV